MLHCNKASCYPLRIPVMNFTPCFTQATPDISRTGTLMLSLPFDLAREQYANAVRVGLIEQSLLASAKFERMICALESATLGPWARRV